jgi:hypothetical protein
MQAKINEERDTKVVCYISLIPLRPAPSFPEPEFVNVQGALESL